MRHGIRFTICPYGSRRGFGAASIQYADRARLDWAASHSALPRRDKSLLIFDTEQYDFRSCFRHRVARTFIGTATILRWRDADVATGLRAESALSSIPAAHHV